MSDRARAGSVPGPPATIASDKAEAPTRPAAARAILLPFLISTLLLDSGNDLGNRQQLRQDLGRPAGRVMDVERDPGAALRFEEAADGWVSRGPVPDQQGDLAPLEG